LAPSSGLTILPAMILKLVLQRADRFELLPEVGH
jgi:hypothetical protein